MKRQIRRGVFETNSSSVHSISISKNGTIQPSNLYVNEDNKISVEFGDFGWGYDTLDSQSEKLSYLLTMIAVTECYEIKDVQDFYDSDGFKLLNEEISTYCNCNGLEVSDEIKIDKYGLDIDGYIDHQSSEDYNSLRDFLQSNETNVIEYIFNNSISMIIDNDNH